MEQHIKDILAKIQVTYETKIAEWGQEEITSNVLKITVTQTPVYDVSALTPEELDTLLITIRNGKFTL